MKFLICILFLIITCSCQSDNKSLDISSRRAQEEGVVVAKKKQPISFFRLGLYTGCNDSYVAGMSLGLLSDRSDEINGIQLAPAVFANETNGISVGVFNFTKTFNGVVIGVVSYSDIGVGLQLGVWNISGWTRKNSFVTTQVGLINDSLGTYCQVGLFNKADSGFQFGILNYNRNSKIPYFPIINYSNRE